MKKRLKRKCIKKINKDLRREIKRLKEEKEKLIYELANLDDLKEQEFKENFEKNYGFMKKLVG